MRKSAPHIAIIVCLAVVVSIGCLGCASSSSNRTQSLIQDSEYRRVMERQKAEMAAEKKASEKIPELNADGYEKQGDQYLSRDNLDLAFVQYHKSLELAPGNLRVLFKMSHLYLEKGLKEEAKKGFQEIINADSKYAPAYEGLGRVCLLSSKFPEAEKNFLKAIQMNPSLWQAFNYLGVLYDRQGKYDEAISHYQKAILLQPEFGFLYNNLGVSLLLKGENEKAVAVFTEAVNLKTSNPKIYNNMAIGLVKLERYPEALEAFKKGGDEATAYYNLGCLFLSKGKPQEAIDAFEKAIESKPGFYVQAHQKMKKAKEALHAPAPEQDQFPQAPASRF